MFHCFTQINISSTTVFREKEKLSSQSLELKVNYLSS